MNSNIIFRLTKNTIIISQIRKDVDYKSLNNTNVIDIKELKFSIDYILHNSELVANFLNVVIIKNNISIVQINNMEIAKFVMDLINTWDHITKLIFKPDKNIELDVFFKILDNNYIREIECYTLANALIERLDMNKNIHVITREQNNFLSDFMKDNILNSYSDIYDKKVLVIKTNFKEVDIEDFKTFIAFNNNLKLIKIVSFSEELMTVIIKELVTFQKQNIVIEIDEKNNDLDAIFKVVNHLKKAYHNYLELNNIKFKLNYSKQYRESNFFKELNFITLKYIFLIIVLISFSFIGINYWRQYRDQIKIDKQINEINEILTDAEVHETLDDNETDIEYIDETDITTTTKKKSTYKSVYYTNFEQVFDKLLAKNSDTVGWLKVNDTKIDYPVVQGKTNSYYLNRDFNKKKNSMGWIFMDYRNDPVSLSKNTIIYGHNIKAGIMFGTLKYMLNSSWYKDKQNQIITFNTTDKNMRWQIFSIYRIPETDDYLKTDFESDDEYQKFLDMLKNRSIYNFNVDVNPTSKILTLSTCNNHVNRTVIHAVLINDEDQKK